MAKKRHVAALRFAVFLCGIGTATIGGSARAQTSPGESSEDGEARRLFGEGSRLYLAGKYDEALDALQGSYRLRPSPNSGLLIARCLRELKRPVEAAQMFSNVEADARRRVKEGDARYAPTADAAATEGARVRAGLGRLHVRVNHPPSGTKVTVDGAPIELVADRDMVVLHGSGEATVRITPPEGAEQSQSVSISPGADVKMEFELGGRERATPPSSSGENPPPTPPPDSDGGRETPWTVPAAWVSGGVAVAGLGVFAGFGIASRSKYNDLQNRCGATGCSPLDRAEADEGKRFQTIANVGLAVGAVAAVATGVFVVWSIKDGGNTSSSPTRGVPTKRPSKAALAIGPGSLSLRVPLD